MTVGVAAHLDVPDLDARKWHFPKGLHAETTFDESKIYPQRAPDDGGAKGRVIDNRWIKPCAPPLPPTAFMYAACPLPRSLGQVLTVLAAQVPLPPQRRGVHTSTTSSTCTQYRTGMLQARGGDVGSFL